MKEKVFIFSLVLIAFVAVCLSTRYLLNKIEKEKQRKSDTITSTLYLTLDDDKSKSKKTIELIKGDYYFKGPSTGYWQMVTNEDDALDDEVFVVTLKSYENDATSIEYVKEFKKYLVSWYQFKEIENDWTDIE